MAKHSSVSQEASDGVTDRLEAGLKSQQKQKTHKKLKTRDADTESKEAKKQRKLERKRKKLQEQAVDDKLKLEVNSHEEEHESGAAHESEEIEPVKAQAVGSTTPILPPKKSTRNATPPKAVQISSLGRNSDALIKSIVKGRDLTKEQPESERPSQRNPRPSLTPSPAMASDSRRSESSSVGVGSAASSPDLAVLPSIGANQSQEAVPLKRKLFEGKNNTADFWDDEPLSKKQKQRSNNKDDTSAKESGALVEAETWENQSGRYRGIVKIDELTNNDEEIEENLAFSSAYISGRPQGVTISGMNFRFHLINPNHGHVFEHEKNILRICSVAGGKVHVTVGNQKFAICANGIWRIKPGERCMARNLDSVDAIIHVSSIER